MGVELTSGLRFFVRRSNEDSIPGDIHGCTTRAYVARHRTPRDEDKQPDDGSYFTNGRTHAPTTVLCVPYAM